MDGHAGELPRFSWLADGVWLSQFEQSEPSATMSLPELPSEESIQQVHTVTQHADFGILDRLWRPEDCVEPRLQALENSSLAHRVAGSVRRSVPPCGEWLTPSNKLQPSHTIDHDADFQVADEGSTLARIQWM